MKLNGRNGLSEGTYAVEYEHQLPTLASNPHPANLDAKLEREDGETVIYCEMKLAEWILNKAGGLRPQYLEAESYLIPEAPAGHLHRSEPQSRGRRAIAQTGHPAELRLGNG